MMMKYTSNKWLLCSSSISAAVFNHMAETIYFLIYFSFLRNLLIISFTPIEKMVLKNLITSAKILRSFKPCLYFSLRNFKTSHYITCRKMTQCPKKRYRTMRYSIKAHLEKEQTKLIMYILFLQIILTVWSWRYGSSAQVRSGTTWSQRHQVQEPQEMSLIFFPPDRLSKVLKSFSA